MSDYKLDDALGPLSRGDGTPVQHKHPLAKKEREE